MLQALQQPLRNFPSKRRIAAKLPSQPERWAVLRTQSSVCLGPLVVLRMRSKPGIPPGAGEQRAAALNPEYTMEENDHQPEKFPLRGLEEISGNQLRSPWQIISKIKIKYSNISAFRYIPKRLIFSFNFILTAFKTLACNFQKRRLGGVGGATAERFAHKGRNLAAWILHPWAPGMGVCSLSSPSAFKKQFAINIIYKMVKIGMFSLREK